MATLPTRGASRGGSALLHISAYSWRAPTGPVRAGAVARRHPGLMQISAARDTRALCARLSPSPPGCGRAVAMYGPSGGVSPGQIRPRRSARRPGPPPSFYHRPRLLPPGGDPRLIPLGGPAGPGLQEAGDPRPGCRHLRGRRGVAGVPARPGRPRSVRGAAGHLRLPPRAAGRDRRDRCGADRALAFKDPHN